MYHLYGHPRYFKFKRKYQQCGHVFVSYDYGFNCDSRKNQLLKTNAKTKVYRNYNSLNVKFLKADLDENLQSNNAANCSVLHVPIKKKNPQI